MDFDEATRVLNIRFDHENEAAGQAMMMVQLGICDVRVFLGLLNQVAALGKCGKVISEEATNFALGVIASIEPRDEVEELGPLVARVSWLDRPPANHRGVIIANEVLDALPVERFRRTQHGVLQFRVVDEGESFALVEAQAPDWLTESVFAIEASIGAKLPAGFVSELSPGLPDWISTLAAALQHGIAFLFDYGVTQREYYAPDRSGGWLRCHFRHHAHNNALLHVGIQDITAWLDFTAVADAASRSGLDIAGYTPQAQFLLGGGLDAEMKDFGTLPLRSQLELSAQVKTLTLPGAMGEHFKCMALRRGDSVTPSAFRLADRTHTL